MAVPPPNVKVYDRPEKTGPSPIIIVVVLLVVAIVGFFIYKAMHHDAPTPADQKPAVLTMSSVTRTDATTLWHGPSFVLAPCVWQ